MKGKMYLWRGRCIYEGEDVFMKGKMYLWREDVFMKGKMYLWRGRCIYEGKMYLWREKKNSGIFEEIENKMLFKKPKKSLDFLIADINNFREFLKEKSQRNVWESVLQLRVSTAQKGNEDVLAADSLQMQQISIKHPWGMVEESLRWGFRTLFLKGKMYLWRGRCIYEGEDVFMKGKMYLWRGRCIYEAEDIFMKGKMYLWKGRCIYEAKMCLWRGRCIYEGEDVFMKGRCIYQGRKKNPGIFEKKIENKMLFKNQRNSWIFSWQT